MTDGYYDAVEFTYDVQSRAISTAVLVETSDLDMNLLGNVTTGEGNYAARIKAQTQNEYDSTGKVTSTKDANGNLTEYEYDLDGKLIKKVDPLGNTTLYTYDLNGNLIEEKNARGISTFYEYDRLNRLIRKKAPAAGGGFAISRYIYDSRGNLIKEISPNNYESNKDTDALAATMKGNSYTYDSMNRRLTSVSPEGNMLQIVRYDKTGNVAKMIDGLRYVGNITSSKGTEYTYDALGRVSTKTDPLGNQSSYRYDVLGNLIEQTDNRGYVTQFEYNPDGTLSKTLYSDGGVVENHYDLLGRKTEVKDQRGYVTTYAYNAFGTIRSEKDPEGNTVENKYDLNGNIVIQKDKNGAMTTLIYDACNRVVEKRQPLDKDSSGNVIYAREKYSYDEVGNLKSLVRTGTKDKTSTRTTNYVYYDNNLVTMVTDDSGAKIISSYDLNGNLIKLERLRTRDADGNAIYDVEQYAYDNNNRLIESIKLADKEDIYNFDSLSGSKSLIDSENTTKVKLITRYEYDILGNRTKEISPTGNVVSFTYDAMNRVKTISRVVNGKLVSISYQYDAEGNKISETNERGYQTEYTYDSLARLKTVTDATGYAFSYSYDLAGNKISQTNAKNSTITYSYDKLNRLKTTTDPFGVVISNREYDASGNLIKEYDANGNPVLYTYDLGKRLVKITTRERNVTKFEYNHYGEKIKTIDGLGNPTSYTYDSAGRLTKVTDANEIKTTYTYDLAGNKLYMIDGRGKTTSYVYGALNKLRSVKDADEGVTTYQYDLEGNVVNLCDKNGNHTTYVYDSRNLLLEKKVVETGDLITYRYDEVGNRIGMSDVSGDTTYTYDANNRLDEIEKDGKTQISYSYDSIGNIVKVTDLAGNTTVYTYDKASRMKTVTFDGDKITYQYDKNGNRSSLTYKSGVKEVYEYNKDDELISLVNQKPNGSELSRYSYTYDGAGRESTKTDSYGTTKYTYDKVGRILKVDAPGKVDIYAYDGAGNRIAVSETYRSLQPSGFVDDATGNDVQYILKKTDYTYSNAGKLLKLVERMYDDSNKEVLRKSVNYYYDSNGNELSNTASWTHPHHIKLRQSTKGAVNADNMANGNSNGNSNTTDPLIDRQNNTFDGFGRLVKVERISAGVRSVSEFVYNGDNLRVTKTVKKSTNKYQEEVTNYLYDRQYVILETDKNNAVKTRYVKGINYVASINAKKVTSYFLFNGHGDVVQTVDTKGNIQNNYEYDIWGNPTLTVETVECAIRYAGEFYDSETGLYYLRARYYNPYIGRFISEDSYWGEDSNPLSLNRYTYAHNDPIQYLDPTGYAVTKKGSEGNQVKKIQKMLQDLGYNTGTVDGVFGSKTEKAVKDFQRDHKLKVDGKVGDDTNAKFKTIMNIKEDFMDGSISVKKNSSSGNKGNEKSKTGQKSSNQGNNAKNNIAKEQKGTSYGTSQYGLVSKSDSITGKDVKDKNSKNAKVNEKPKTSSNTSKKTDSTRPITLPTLLLVAGQGENKSSDKSYAEKTVNQVVLGNYTEDVTLVGTGIQVASGIVGIDVVADVRDISADFVNWKWSWGHVGQTALDLVGVLPIVGVLKSADEVATVVKHADEVGDVVKHVDDVENLIKKGAEAQSALLSKTDDVGDAVKGASKSDGSLKMNLQFFAEKGASKSQFKSQDLLDTHYQKHVVDQGELGNISKNQYLENAQSLVNSKPGGNILSKTRTNGDTIIYNKVTNEFAVSDKAGNIKTYFKPSNGINYYNNQK